MVSKNNKINGNNTIGQIFTPDYVAEFMVKNISSFIKDKNKNFHDCKVLEPSVGKGIFLKHLSNKFPLIEAYEMDFKLKKYLLKSYPNVLFKF
ncbi:MAG: hypothetical protein ACXACB_14930, partial [Promethearchaeota archaeon]